MKIHYNNGEKEKIIDNVLSVTVIDSNAPVVACLNNGKELNISLNNIEMILDERAFEDRDRFVEVVRCEDCVHKVDYKGRIMCNRNATKVGDEWCGLTATEIDRFCSDGKRKDKSDEK